jgi:hypothetical protein
MHRTPKHGQDLVFYLGLNTALAVLIVATTWFLLPM